MPRSSKTLRSQAIRMASSLPEDSELRSALLRELTAASTGADLLDHVINRQQFVKAYRDIRKLDPQTGDQLREVYQALAKEMEISAGASHALNRLRQIVDNAGRWSPGLIRNNVGKALNSLGLSTSGYMFASENKEAGADYPVGHYYFSWVGNRTPWNRDVWGMINRLSIGVPGLDHTVQIRLQQHRHSDPLTHTQEQAGDKQEIVFQVSGPANAGAAVAEAIGDLARKLGFKSKLERKLRDPKTHR